MSENIEKTKRMIEVMQAYVDGETVGFTVRWTNSGPLEFAPILKPEWSWHVINYMTYSQFLAEQKTKPSINWDHVSPEFRFMATNRGGITFLFMNEPLKAQHAWQSGGHKSIPADGFASFKRGTCYWEDSLVERPDEHDEQ